MNQGSWGMASGGVRNAKLLNLPERIIARHVDGEHYYSKAF